MINNDPLINTGLIYYEDMFASNIKTNNRKTPDLMDRDKLINTSEIFYKDMLKHKS
ncbi:MAG: hypothetical protein N4A68_04660 [Maledivibacter sp.]|jgi:hypothetical protein|nr:hypothetical protein [Maledivibacter sp.]